MANLIAKQPPVTGTICFACVLAGISGPSMAHHGVAGLGAAGLRGPGAPIEAATSATLPAGETLAYFKLDRAQYETYDADPTNPESDYANYWMVGLGYGFTSWFSAYAFLPYHSKVSELAGAMVQVLHDGSSPSQAISSCAGCKGSGLCRCRVFCRFISLSTVFSNDSDKERSSSLKLRLTSRRMLSWRRPLVFE